MILRMQIKDIQNSIANSWDEVKTSWQDDMSKKYKTALLDNLDTLLSSIERELNHLHWASEDAIEQIDQFQTAGDDITEDGV